MIYLCILGLGLIVRADAAKPTGVDTDIATRAVVTCEPCMSNSMRIHCPPRKFRSSELQVNP